MKHLFAVVFVVLVLASVAVYSSYPDLRSEAPVIYWVTDINPAREEQVRMFHRWLIAHGHTTPSGGPAAELRLDSSNNDMSKKIIQGVSGVGGDVMDIFNAEGGSRLPYYQAIGLLEDVTVDAQRMGYGVDQTYPAIEPEIMLDGRQYAFPCNVFVRLLWVNKETFRRFGQPVPSTRWTFEEFEEAGKRFVEAANPPGERRAYFFVADLDLQELHRSLGLSALNETMTRCTLDDERFAQALRLKYKWTYEDHILPSLADRSSFDTASGYGGSTFQLFNDGHYAMCRSGRYALIQFRKFGDLDLTVVESPNGGFPNAQTGSRCAGVYVGGKHKDLAKLFQAFLASEDYNMQIVRDADALPPNPMYLRTEAYLHPPEHPNEWQVHNVFADAADDIAVGGAYSPFVLNSIVYRKTREAEDACMNDRLTAKQAGAQAAQRVNAEIQRTLSEQPNLRPLYDLLVKQQEQIDRLRAEGRKVPLELITNPFYQRYYAARGWAE